MAAHPPSPAAEDSLDALLGRAVRGMRQSWRAAAEAAGLAPHQGRALLIVAGEGPLRLSTLADRLRIAPRSATEVADALQERGFITRTSDPADRRAVLLTTTGEGDHVAGEVAAARRAGAEEFFGRLSPADRVDLERILRTLAET